MLTFTRALRISTAAITAALVSAPAFAHGVAGNRFFPATIATDDPAVADELSLPTASWSRTGDDPSAVQTDIAGEYSKRITSKFGVSLAGDWTHLQGPNGAAASGFQNLETTFKFQGLTNARHEAIVSGGISVEWGGTGSEQVGAERVSTITPTLYFGKGAGDLPDRLAWLQPAAVTGSLGYAIPASGDGPKVLQSSVALEYSLPYLHSHVRDFGLPDFINHVTPLVEMSFETPVAGGQGLPTTGTINPGAIWAGQHYQVGLEAMIPINRDSGRSVGAVIQVHFYLDDLFPHSIGRPIW
jgi:hypothetical protein